MLMIKTPRQRLGVEMNVRLSLLDVEYLLVPLLHLMNDVVLKLSYQLLHLQFFRVIDAF